MQLIWPDELKPILEHQAAEAGCASVDEYTLRVYLQAAEAQSPGQDWDSIIHAAGLDPDCLERELLDGLASGPATPMTANDWSDVRQRVRDRLAAQAPS